MCIFLCAVAAVNQGNTQTTFGEFRKLPTKQKAKLVTDSLSAALHFTTVQYSKVYPIILDGAQNASIIIKSGDGRLSKGKQLKALLAGQEDRIKPVVTPQQFNLYKSKKEQLIAYYRKHWQDEKLVFNASK